MTKYIQRKDGTFAGSIGSGKDTVPTAAPHLPAVSAAPSDDTLEYGQRITSMLQSMNEHLDASTTRMKNLSNDLTAIHDRTSAELDAIHTQYADLPALQAAADQAWAELTGQAEAAEQPRSASCGVAGCSYQLAPSSFNPAHHASARCQSGSHPHCTCDTCF